MSTAADLALAQRLEQARAAAMRANDRAALAALLADDLAYVHSSGGTDSKLSYLAALENGALRYVEVELDDVAVVRCAAGWIALTGRMAAQVERAGRCIEVRSVYLAVWVDEGQGAWRLLAFQGTSTGAPPAATGTAPR